MTHVPEPPQVADAAPEPALAPEPAAAPEPPATPEPPAVTEPPLAPEPPAEAPASNALARLLAARGGADGERPSWSRLPSVSLPSVSLPALTLPTLSLPTFGRRDVESDGRGVTATSPAPVDVPAPPPPPADLHTALEDALEEAVALDPATPADPRDGLDDVLAGWVARAIEAYPRPSYPMTREWDVSVQGLVRLVPFVPRFATAPLGLLDRFGAVTLSAEKVGLDGKDVPWDRVLEIRTEPAWTCLSAEVFEADLARFVTVIPPVPGRGWVLRRISELLMSLYLSVLPPEDAGEDLLDADGGEGVMEHVVTTVVHQRRFGTGEATVSAPSALLQLVLPGTVETIVATARARGVTVTHVPAQETSVGTVIQRAATWRRTAIGLRDDLAARWGR